MSAMSLMRGSFQGVERAAFLTCRSRAAQRRPPVSACDAKRRLPVRSDGVEQRIGFNSLGTSNISCQPSVCLDAVEQRIGFNSLGASNISCQPSVSLHPQTESRTTYEGLDDGDVDFLRPRSAGSTGFSRSTFVAGERKTGLQEQYLLGSIIGRGSMATVYRAVNVHTQHEVAVKAIQKSSVRDPQMLSNEVWLHKATDHPNILRLLDTFEDDTMLYLVTELCEDGDLSRYLEFEHYSTGESTPMTESDALRLFQQVVASARYLHRMGIVHRDLKPSNFLLSTAAEQPPGQGEATHLDLKSRILKLTDFGVSATCATTKHRLTKKVGTDGFMAPEVVQLRPYNEKADIFSMGAILHQLLTGETPKWRGNRYEFDTVGLSTVSAEVRELVESLLQVRPENRPSAEMLAQHPLLNNAQTRSLDGSARLDTILDRMHTYSSFPLLKRAVLVAMISRAESDTDFAPCIEKFTSIGPQSNMKIRMSPEDIYDSYADPLKDIVRSGRRCGQFLGHGALRLYHTMQDFRGDLQQLIVRIDASGSISYSEWLAATVDYSWFLDPERIADTFRLFDKDQDGCISRRDLMATLPDVFSDILVDDVLQEAQLTRCINKESFSEMIRA